jgi:hypothetical protein
VPNSENGGIDVIEVMAEIVGMPDAEVRKISNEIRMS